MNLIQQTKLKIYNSNNVAINFLYQKDRFANG